MGRSTFLLFLPRAESSWKCEFWGKQGSGCLVIHLFLLFFLPNLRKDLELNVVGAYVEGKLLAKKREAQKGAPADTAARGPLWDMTMDQLRDFARGVEGRSSSDREVARARKLAETKLSAIEEKIMELMRETYRSTWTLPHVRDVLANYSNLMIFNASDLCYGSADSLNQPWDPLLLDLSLRVFREYQRQLWDPSLSLAPSRETTPSGWSTSPVLKSEHHFHRWDDVGVLCVDTISNRIGRGCRFDADGKLIGPAQWKDIETILEEQTDLRTLMVVLPTPFSGNPSRQAQSKRSGGAQKSQKLKSLASLALSASSMSASSRGSSDSDGQDSAGVRA